MQSKEPVAEPELPTVEEAPTSVSIVEEEEQEEIGSDGLMQLVRFAARTKHDTSGAVFDEAYNVDVVTDVRFLFITTSLPLGGEFPKVFLIRNF